MSPQDLYIFTQIHNSVATPSLCSSLPVFITPFPFPLSISLFLSASMPYFLFLSASIFHPVYIKLCLFISPSLLSSSFSLDSSHFLPFFLLFSSLSCYHLFVCNTSYISGFFSLLKFIFGRSQLFCL